VSKEDFLLHGSNTLGDELIPKLLHEFLISENVKDIKITAERKLDQTVLQGVLPDSLQPVTFKVYAPGTAIGIQHLNKQTCDIAMASRRMTDDELKSFANPSEIMGYMIALDGIAIIVHNSNPESTISLDDVRMIFAGITKNWKNGQPINVYAPDDNSGTFKEFVGRVLQKDDTFVNTRNRYADIREVVIKVSQDPNGIGFVGSAFLTKTVKPLAVSEAGSPLEPTTFNISTEDYPLTRRLYLYTSGNSRQPWSSKFINFVLSDIGREIIGKAGFVQTNITTVRFSRSDATEKYRNLTNNAERLSLDFRFDSGKSNLDDKALADLERVIKFLRSAQYANKKVLLLGFADNSGTDAASDSVSWDRADAVRQKLQQSIPQAIDRYKFGSQLPVANNATSDGKKKNRRVEIWIAPAK